MQPLQYITDLAGKRTAVLIPISEWENIVQKYPDLSALELELHKKGESAQYLMGDFAGTLDPAIAESLLKHLEENRW